MYFLTFANLFYQELETDLARQARVQYNAALLAERDRENAAQLSAPTTTTVYSDRMPAQARSTNGPEGTASEPTSAPDHRSEPLKGKSSEPSAHDPWAAAKQAKDEPKAWRPAVGRRV